MASDTSIASKPAREFLAGELERLMALPLETDEDANRWDAECAKVQTELEKRFPDFEVEHHVHHFFTDSDIRQKDIGYRKRQHQAISDYIRRLRLCVPQTLNTQPQSDILPTTSRKIAVFLVALAWGIPLSASLVIFDALQSFYRGTASLAPGTEIRPMGLAFVLVASGIGSIFIGGLCAVFGIIMSLKQRRWLLASIALLALGLCWVPLTISHWGFDHIVALRKLVLEE